MNVLSEGHVIKVDHLAGLYRVVEVMPATDDEPESVIANAIDGSDPGARIWVGEITAVEDEPIG